ncbi:MAG TPA: polysaccharide biosynthesis/export family protein [Nevskiaceae bacterium]|nr:polysaccharide biosynthesis/export family protein [Nevskiaceae bacterium]
MSGIHHAIHASLTRLLAGLGACLLWQACLAADPVPDQSLRMDSALSAQQAAVVSTAASPSTAATPVAAATEANTSINGDPLLKLGAGDLVSVQVFGRPEMSISAYVADDGNLTLPLVGAVQVAGLSPSEAAQRVADALKKGEFLVNPQVNITLSQYHSQQVSVLGEVHTPGRYALESKTNIFDLLAQAGGLSADAADTGYLLRRDRNGDVVRLPIDLKNLTANQQVDGDNRLRGGDSIYVPKASQFYIYGEVHAPNRYRLEPGMTVVEALTVGGGITERGSERRIEIRRRTNDGKYKTIDAHPTDPVQADDVIRVKERIF